MESGRAKLENAATFLTAQTAVEMPQMAKRKPADRILDEVLAVRRPISMVMEIEGEEEQDEG